MNPTFLQNTRKDIMDKSFVDDFNAVVKIRITRRCICKICDRELTNEKIVYLRSFRLQGQPFHICIPCWEKINLLVEEETKESKKLR